MVSKPFFFQRDNLTDCMAGAYVIVFIKCARVLYNKYADGKSGKYLTMVALAIFTLVTTVRMFS